MKRTEQLLNYMTEHLEDYLLNLQQAVLLESPTEGAPTELAACRLYFEELFRSIGFHVERVPSLDPRFGTHLLMEYGSLQTPAAAGSDAETGSAAQPAANADKSVAAAQPAVPNRLLIGGHYDTVHKLGAFGEEPWRVEGDKIIGPGVLDMKGGDVMVWMAVKALQDLHLMPENAQILFFLTSDEEAGSYGSSQLYKSLASRSKATFIVESSVGVEGDYIGGLKCGRFGRGNYTFTAHGIPCHSGIDPTAGESGLLELSKQAQALTDLTYFNKINPATGNPETVTVGCTALHSGEAGWPTVPGDGTLTIDARYSTMALAEEYDSRFRNLTSFNPNVSITVSGGIEKPPFDKDLPGNKTLQALAIDTGAEFGVEMHPGVVRGGSDGNFTASTGCPTLDGMGVTGGAVHQLGEYIRISHLPFRLAFLAEMMLRVLEDSALR
ncbi:MAG: M20 family metallopeptidase [Clostridiales bacterium]|nr:M20 family metallopeptidase [Clostridiales bacterium]